MATAWLVSRVERFPRRTEKKLHVFTEKDKAINYIVDYFYNHSTMEDRETKAQIDDWHDYVEYNLYTSQYGDITMKLEPIPCN